MNGKTIQTVMLVSALGVVALGVGVYVGMRNKTAKASTAAPAVAPVGRPMIVSRDNSTTDSADLGRPRAVGSQALELAVASQALNPGGSLAPGVQAAAAPAAGLLDLTTTRPMNVTTEQALGTSIEKISAPAFTVPTTPPTPNDAIPASMGYTADLDVRFTKVPPNLKEYTAIGFTKLSGFKYLMPDVAYGSKPEDAPAPPKNQIPAAVKALHGKKIALRGFMVPTVFEGDGAVKGFILTNSRALCCFGQMPEINEWVDVSLVDNKTCEYANDLPVTVFGTLEVGEQMEGNIVLSIFRMQGVEVLVEKDEVNTM